MRSWSIHLDTPKAAILAKAAVDRALARGGMKATFAEQNRTDEQNKRMWALLDIITEERPVWNHFPMNSRRWKGTFMDALGMETDATPSMEGGRVIPLGHSTRELSKGQFSDLFEVIHAFAAREGIDLKEPTEGKHNDTE